MQPDFQFLLFQNFIVMKFFLKKGNLFSQTFPFRLQCFLFLHFQGELFPFLFQLFLLDTICRQLCPDLLRLLCFHKQLFVTAHFLFQIFQRFFHFLQLLLVTGKQLLQHVNCVSHFKLSLFTPFYLRSKKTILLTYHILDILTDAVTVGQSFPFRFLEKKFQLYLQLLIILRPENPPENIVTLWCIRKEKLLKRTLGNHHNPGKLVVIDSQNFLHLCRDILYPGYGTAIRQKKGSVSTLLCGSFSPRLWACIFRVSLYPVFFILI